MIVVDTSVWIDYLRGVAAPAADELRSMIAQGQEHRITEPVVMELCAGAHTPREGEAVEALVNGLPVLPFDPMLDFRAAGDLYRLSARNGHPIRSMVDCLIAATTIRHGATLLHHDRDFGYLAEISPLSLYPGIGPD